MTLSVKTLKGAAFLNDDPKSVLEVVLRSLHFNRAFPEVRFRKVGSVRCLPFPRFESPKMIKTKVCRAITLRRPLRTCFTRLPCLEGWPGALGEVDGETSFCDVT